MKRLLLISTIITVISVFINAQTTVEAEKEKITSIMIGPGLDQVSYAGTEEGFYSPEGPVIDENGRLYFYPSTTRDKLRCFYKGKWEAVPLFKFLQNTTGHQILFISQQGQVKVGETIYVLEPGYGEFFFSANKERSIPITREYSNYFMPFGNYIESPSFSYSTEVLSDRTLKVRDLTETRTWLPTQPGGFSIGEDGLLYRNGVLWSAVKPEKLKPFDYRYLGRLASGHVIWAGGRGAMESEFYIATPGGNIECHLTFPWAPVYGKTEYNPFNYGLGPWGEFYCLIAPLSVKGKDWPPKDSSSELVVVRNHLKYFGRLNDDKVRLRKGPSTSTESLGTYPVKTGFRILEKGTVEETIGGQKNVWYKVRLLDGTEGWFFGAFVHNLYDGPNGNPPPWPNVADW